MSETNAVRIVIRKSARVLELFDGGEIVSSYKIILGRTPVGDKETEGDGRTPEGEFYIFTKNPKSAYFLSLGLSYPNNEHARRALAADLISQDEFDQIADAIDRRAMPPQKTRLGGEIYIHGGGTERESTRGCIALADSDIREIFDRVSVLTPVTIVP
jgi:murein L,D-transpeptidase YafK